MQRILIVDDEPDTADSISQVLALYLPEAKIEIAPSIHDGLLFIKRNGPVLAYVAHRPFPLSGFEFAAGAAKISPSSAVVLYSTIVDSALMIKGAQHQNILAVLSKVFGPSDLVSVAREHFSARPTARNQPERRVARRIKAA